MLTRMATSSIQGISRIAMRPRITKKGVPGGCGMPRMFETAMNSPQSQNETVGAIVAKKTA